MDKVHFLSLVYIYIYINILRRYSEQEVLLNQPEVHSQDLVGLFPSKQVTHQGIELT